MLDVQHVTVRFGGLTAVDDMSLSVREGTIHALIGPNGAGKTTLFNVIGRVFPPTSGSVHFEGTDLLAQPPHGIMKLGVARTFQNLELFRLSNVYENIASGYVHRFDGGLRRALGPSGRRHNREVRDRVYATAELLGIKNRLNSFPAALPYGILKRVELARAMVAEPRLLLLDEPAAGLNDDETADLMRVLTQAAAGGMTLLLVEHDMHLVMNISQTVTVMDFGKKIAEGRPTDVARDPEVIRVYLGEGAQAS